MRSLLSQEICSFSFQNEGYRRIRLAARTRPWDFLLPPENRSRLSHKGEVVRQTELRSQLRLVAFRGENRFRIGGGNFAYRDPAESTGKRANRKRDRCKRNQVEKPEDQCKRTVQDFADANKSTRSVFVYRVIGDAMFVDCQPNSEGCFDSGREESGSSALS